MLALALLPLTAYFAFLTLMQFRRCPTLISGEVDFSLLAWGLFGFVSLGAGKLLIPLYLFNAWGLFTWLFWLCFYFVATIYTAKCFRCQWVIYHVRRESVLPAMFDLARQIDPKAEWCGNVLSLHGLQIQWSIVGDSFGGHLSLKPTQPAAYNPYMEMLRGKFAGLCRSLSVSPQRIRWAFLLLTFACAAAAGWDLCRHFTEMLHIANDYWIP